MTLNLSDNLFLFSPLLDFEPNLKIGDTEIGKRLLKSLDKTSYTLDQLTNALEEFPILTTAIQIASTSIEIIEELKHPTLKSTKNRKDFKAKSDYLNAYINGFKTTLQLYENLTYEKEAADLKEIIEIFENIRDKKTRLRTLQKLIFEYINHYTINRELHKSLMASVLKEENNSIVEKLYKKQERNTRIYESYFDGLDISAEDIERSMLIKLYYLYAKHSTNKGRGDANPNKRIEAIFLSLTGKRMLISRKKMQDVYIKGFCLGVPIFDYKSKTIREDAIDMYFKTKIEPYFDSIIPVIPALDSLIKARRTELINELILI
jgi:hypothetical protein